MSLDDKPHTSEWFEKDVEPLAGQGKTLRGQMTPMTPDSAMKTFGIELRYAHMWLGDAPDRLFMHEGGFVLCNGRTFSCEALGSYDGIGECDHAQALLQEVIGA